MKMINNAARKLALACLDVVDGIFACKPPTEKYTRDDLSMMRKSKQLRKKIMKKGETNERNIRQ